MRCDSVFPPPASGKKTAKKRDAQSMLTFFDFFAILYIRNKIGIPENNGVAPVSIAGARKNKHAEERVASIKHSA